MDIQEILKMYNEDGLTLVEIGDRLNSSKSSISRFLATNGYVFRKSEKKYVKFQGIQETINNVSRETINTGNNETINTNLLKTINTVKCTFDLPEQLHREIKVKCALEGIKMVDFVRDVLQKAIKK